VQFAVSPANPSVFWILHLITRSACCLSPLSQVQFIVPIQPPGLLTAAPQAQPACKFLHLSFGLLKHCLAGKYVAENQTLTWTLASLPHMVNDQLQSHGKLSATLPCSKAVQVYISVSVAVIIPR